ncbi:hypothetical protein EXIGLDRAFT_772546 [Exidia glandulosa HHB12029]|uniref:Uncharacterized protein n=1 Tax=Exidia glandulosa HHB12029 TaxID=1314781 RepID=A0A165F9Y7_EXIGL|nr:hypothetical protein EXIGLDRAFT_772546 [Exidia glandulosa HHB12029]
MDEAPIVGQDVLVEDNDPRVVYSPPGAWTIPPDQLSHIYHGHTYHFTRNESAIATLHFNGSRIWYYSDFNSDHGSYTVIIDSENPVIASSVDGSTYRGQQLLFSTALDPGPHTIVITNTDNGRAMGVDYF